MVQNLPTTTINELQIGKSNSRGEEKLHQPQPAAVEHYENKNLARIAQYLSIYNNKTIYDDNL